jgi:general L-amino acid transport system substrate-binding protein
MGLAADWACKVVKQIGNYGEVFDQILGSHPPFGMLRGFNDLWTKGGLHYPSIFR